MPDKKMSRLHRWSVRLLGGLIALAGLGMAVPGVYLLTLGGSLYYALAGALFVAAGVGVLLDRAWGTRLSLLTWLATIAWALWEIGFNGWALLPRVDLLTGLGLALAMLLSQEAAFRTSDIGSGRLLWETRLPTTGHANPMSYRSARTGRQFVIVSASGHPRFMNSASDELIAYAQPPGS